MQCEWNGTAVPCENKIVGRCRIGDLDDIVDELYLCQEHMLLNREGLVEAAVAWHDRETEKLDKAIAFRAQFLPAGRKQFEHLLAAKAALVNERLIWLREREQFVGRGAAIIAKAKADAS